MVADLRKRKGYLMVESLRIKNFQCFENVYLENLRKVNVIVGPSASGKTSLLEAIYLGAGRTPELIFRMHGWRGAIGSELNIPRDRHSYESLWRDIFFTLDQSKTIEIALESSRPGYTQSLTISYQAEESLTLPIGEQLEQFRDSFAIRPLTFRYRKGSEETVVRPEFTDKGLRIGVAGVPMTVMFLCSANRYGLINEAPIRFSELSRRGQEREAIKAMQEIFPFIQDLSIEVVGGSSVIYAKVSGIREKIPMALVSEGAMKFLHLTLALHNVTEGIILLDEVENGFYWKNLPNIWESFLKLCERFRVQMFVTTHSRECLQALLPAVAQSEQNFSLIRMESANGSCIPRHFDGKHFHAAIEQDVEFR